MHAHIWEKVFCQLQTVAYLAVFVLLTIQNYFFYFLFPLFVLVAFIWLQTLFFWIFCIVVFTPLSTSGARNFKLMYFVRSLPTPPPTTPRNWQADSNITVEILTWTSQNSLKKEQNRSTHTSRCQSSPQSYSDEDCVALGWIHRPQD